MGKTKSPRAITSIPHWGFETLRVIQDARRMTADIEAELRYAARLRRFDPRMQERLQAVRDPASALQLQLSALDLTTHQVLAARMQAAAREPGADDARP